MGMIGIGMNGIIGIGNIPIFIKIRDKNFFDSKTVLKLLASGLQHLL